jgi:hypothetical protein
MPLALDDRGLLRRGVHTATLEEVEELFARFQRSDRRIRLFRKLRDYVAEVRKAECGSAIILDGSFVMGCVDEPDDLDLILVLPRGWDPKEDLKPYQYNLVSQKRVRKQYGFDVVVVLPNSRQQRGWIRFFSRVNVKWRHLFGWPARSRKGIVRVKL